MKQGDFYCFASGVQPAVHDSHFSSPRRHERRQAACADRFPLASFAGVCRSLS